LDLLTSYLEVRYADVLLRKDSVQTLQRQLALRSLQDSGAGRLSELLEQPPAALTAGRTLSPQERQAVSDTLDGLLSSKQYEGYRQAVLQLYCDGLITWGGSAVAQLACGLTAAVLRPLCVCTCLNNAACSLLCWLCRCRRAAGVLGGCSDGAGADGGCRGARGRTCR
jgi:hypothetical protein